MNLSKEQIAEIANALLTEKLKEFIGVSISKKEIIRVLTEKFGAKEDDLLEIKILHVIEKWDKEHGAKCDDLLSEIETIKEEVDESWPAMNSSVFYIDEVGYVRSAVIDNTKAAECANGALGNFISIQKAKALESIGNLYRTKEEAEAVVKLLKEIAANDLRLEWVLGAALSSKDAKIEQRG